MHELKVSGSFVKTTKRLTNFSEVFDSQSHALEQIEVVKLMIVMLGIQPKLWNVSLVYTSFQI